MPKPSLILSDSKTGNPYSGVPALVLTSQTSSPKDNSYKLIHLTYPIVSVPFITITVKSDPPISFTWNPKDDAPDYFTSLSQTRYVSKGNTCKLNITYVPRPNEDSDAFEAALWSAKGRCEYQYGLAGYRSAVYAGQIYDYTVNMSNGVQEYSIDLIGAEGQTLNTWVLDAQWNIPAKEDRDDDWIGNYMSPYLYVYQAVHGIIRNYLNDEYNFIDDTVDYDLSEEDRAGVDKKLRFMDAAIASGRTLDILSSGRAASKILKKYGEPYRFLDSALDITGCTPLEAIKKLSEHLIKYSSDTKKYNPSVMFYISVTSPKDTGEKGEIRLFNSETARPPEGADTEVTYVFEWNHRDSTVKSWSTEYRGVAVMFNDTGEGIAGSRTVYELGSGNSQTVEVMKDYSALIKSAQIDPLSGLDANEVIEINDKTKRRFHRVQQYPYQATLEVLGVPDTNFYLGKHIYVIPYINGDVHHSAGEYMVLGINDTVSSSGFVTKLSLVKIVTDDWKDKLGIPREELLPEKKNVTAASIEAHSSVGITDKSRMHKRQTGTELVE